MEIYEALKKDHKKVRGLLAELVKKNNDIDTCKRLVREIRDELIPHARAEEAVFYNSIKDLGAGALLQEAMAEHLLAESLLRMLQTVEIFDAKGLALAEKLKEALEHHIREEEEDLIPAARELFLDKEAQDLGSAFEKLKLEIKEESIAGTTWEMIKNLMPQRLRKNFLGPSTSVQK